MVCPHVVEVAFGITKEEGLRIVSGLNFSPVIGNRRSTDPRSDDDEGPPRFR